MEALINLLWNKSGLWEFMENIFLGFGLNCLTVILVVAFGISQRNGTRNSRKSFWEKSFFYFLPSVGATLTFLDIILLFKKALQREFVAYYKWLFICSKFAVWTSIVSSSLCIDIRGVFRNRIVCFWWIIKVLVEIPHLILTFDSLEVLIRFNDSFIVLLDIIFAFSINIFRAKQRLTELASIEDPLLSADTDLEECCQSDSESNPSYLDILTFESISTVLNHGATKQLEFEYLLKLPNDIEPSFCHETLLSAWRAQCASDFSKPSLFWAICRAYWWPYTCLGFLKVINDSVGFAGPLLLNKLIRFLQQGSGKPDGYVLAISLGLTSILKSLLDTQYTFQLNKLRLKLRSGIMTLVYQQCLWLNLAARSKFSEGEIQTFMSIDVDRTVNLFNSFHDLWSLPFQIGVALYLLYTQVKFAFIAGLAITILLIPVNKWISTLIANASEKMMKQKDERIRRTGELLTHIRTLKMYSWEIIFSGWLKDTRSLEVKHLGTRKYLDAWCVFFWATTPTLFSLFTFGLYTLMGHELDAATVFTCLALFNTLIAPLNSFPWVINGLIDVVISTRRLSRYLSSSVTKSEPNKLHKASSSQSFLNSQSKLTFEDMAIRFSDACCAWSMSGNHVSNLVLHNVSLGLQKGSFTAIIGEVCSGKSSMLNSILGEMRLVSGSIQSSGSMAYVPQVPWILSGTIRDNILFGTDYDSKRYSDTLWACALNDDISSMDGGDMAYIGEKGINLSGGQRARLALARAIYNGSDIVLLDDVLSAVDSRVALRILNDGILGPLMNRWTRVLCTHNIQAINSADIVIVMEKGYVKWHGSRSDFSLSSYSKLSPINELDTDSLIQEQEENQNNLEENIDTSIIASDEAQLIIEDEARKEGRVEITVYKSYAAFCGFFVTIMICISAVLMQASRNGNDLWLSYWVDTSTANHNRDIKEHSTSFYLIILCVFSFVNSGLTLARAFSFAFGGLRAAVRVHDTLLQNLINAPVRFFDQTPTGRILNRLSSDLYTIDDSLPFILNILLANFVGLLGIVLVLSYVQVLFLLLLLPFWYIYSKLQFYYRSTSRELRRLDSVSRSPIYASFTETLDGAATIRAFNSEEHFLTRFIEHVALYQKTSYTELTASLWLSLRLQLLAALVISFIALMAIAGSNGNLPISFGTPGLVGLALSYAAPAVSLLSSFLTSFTETEKEMVSVERALEYMNIPDEDQQSERQSLSPDWPNRGEIEFQNVTLRYGPSLPPALNDITFTVKAGTQVGVIGRTGAGKSSILNALFRLTPLCNGNIIVDEINITDHFSARDLRSRFAVVPQTPFLFEGSLRDNLDPFHVNDDSKIWNVLERCHIRERVEAIGGLEIQVKESGTSFSVGQRQLLCLARALLKSSLVMCFDECTANIDPQTASILQNAIANEFRVATVITIAHRISTVLNMDNILVLDRGTLVEHGNPQALLQNQSSKFSSFAKASTM